jgi:hypothetical protein
MKRILAMAALVALVALTGCGSSSNGGNISAASLVGTWNDTSLGAAGQTTVNCPGTLTSGGSTNTCTAGDHITFNSDGTFTQVSSPDTTSGTYSVSGNTITLVTTVKNGVIQTPAKTQTAILVFTGTTALTAFPTSSTTGQFFVFTKVVL